MSDLADGYQSNIHALGMTAAWSLLFNITVLCGALRFDKAAALAHTIFGWIIFIMTFTFILYLLAPYGFNLSTGTSLQYAHGILGCMMIGFVVIQVVGGLITKMLQQNKVLDILKIKKIKILHRYFGYFLGILYKIDVCWAWFNNLGPVFISLIIWEGLCIIALISIKIFLFEMQRKIVDIQTQDCICSEVSRIREVSKITQNYIIFANYVYDSRNFEQIHPGGSKVIELMKGREVDRFIYGMYSAELYPQLSPYSHSAYSLQLIGPPIAKLVVPQTYAGFRDQINEGQIKYKSLISEKTQIYSLGITLKYGSLKFLGYTDLRQLGQYYSFTIIKKITRIYTTVNFLNAQNIEKMTELLKVQRDSSLKKGADKKRKTETQMPKILEQQKQSLKQKLNNINQQQLRDSYIPIMMKVYNNGKLTSGLRSVDFLNTPIQISIPRGRGLQLDVTPAGRIIIVAGGTGLFPFSDMIDLLYKAHIIEEGNPISSELIHNDPLLKQKPFSKYFFVFLIAINEPEDIHPITLGQLIRLSQHGKLVKVVLRVSKNSQQLSKSAGNIQFTREYFNKRVLTEASVAGFSRVWICGPPKMNTDTANILVQNGFKKQQFLLV